MAILLRQSTEIIEALGPFVDKTDGVTEETGLAGAGTEIRKNGGSFAAGPVLGTHDAEGWYPITLTTTHTNTLGPLVVKSHDSATHLPVWREYMVIPAVVYDSIVLGTDYLQIDVAQWLSATAPAMTGDAFARIGANGASLTALGDTRLANLDATVSSRGTGTALTSQEVRDAMKLAATAGDPAAGSIDKHADDIVEDTGTTLPAAITALQTHGDAEWGDTSVTITEQNVVIE